jgi:hypothetical protein
MLKCDTIHSEVIFNNQLLKRARKEASMKGLLINTAGILSFINLAWFALKIWRHKAATTSTASWLMWVVLDLVILGSTIATHQPCALALSYTLGASAVLLVHFKLGRWIWTRVETVSAIGAAISAVLWQTLSAEWGVIAGIIAMNVAGVPLIIGLWKQPDRQAFWVFATTAIACLMTLLGTWPWTIGGSLLPGAGMIYNAAIAYMVLRDKRAPVRA